MKLSHEQKLTIAALTRNVGALPDNTPRWPALNTNVAVIGRATTFFPPVVHETRTVKVLTSFYLNDRVARAGELVELEAPAAASMVAAGRAVFV